MTNKVKNSNITATSLHKRNITRNITMTDKINFFAEQVTKELFESGLTPEQALAVASIMIMTITPHVHPAGFDVHGTLFNLSVESILAEAHCPDLH